MTPEDLSKPETTEFDDGVKAKLTPDGEIKYTFPEPRDLTDVKLQADTEDTPLEAVPYTATGPKDPIPLTGGDDEPESNPTNVPDVIAVVIRTTDGSDISPEDIPSIEVETCKECMSSIKVMVKCLMLITSSDYSKDYWSHTNSNSNTDKPC